MSASEVSEQPSKHLLNAALGKIVKGMHETDKNILGFVTGVYICMQSFLL